jgi:hypothetical protein
MTGVGPQRHRRGEKVTLKVQLNDKVEGHTKFGTTKRAIGWLRAISKVMSYRF